MLPLLLLAAILGAEAQYINIGVIPPGGNLPQALWPDLTNTPVHIDAPDGHWINFTIVMFYQNDNYAFDDLPVVNGFTPGLVPQNTVFTNENCATLINQFCYVGVSHLSSSTVAFILPTTATYAGGSTPQNGPTITLDWLPAAPPAPPVTGTWNASTWSTCNRDCGGGYQTRTVVCSDSNGNQIDGFNCPYPQPLATQWCNPQRCTGAYYWRNYPFFSTDCSTRCTNTYHYAPPGFCKAGTSTSATNDTTENSSLCATATPARLFNQGDCPNAQQCSFKNFGFGTCASNGQQVRTVWCLDGSNNPRDTSDCLLASITRPSLTRACLGNPTIDAKATLPITAGGSVLTIVGTNLDGGDDTLVTVQVTPPDITFPGFVLDIISNTTIEVRFDTPLSSNFTNHKISVMVSNGNFITSGWVVPGDSTGSFGFSVYTHSVPLLLSFVFMVALFLGQDH